MPQLSDTMDSGKILSWNKSEGDSINRGDILAEVETDKANLEIESFHQGTLLKIVVPAEQSAGVGDVIAFIGEPGESVGDISSNGNGHQANPQSSAEASHAQSKDPKQSQQLQDSAAPEQISGEASFDRGQSGRLKASPLARKVATELNVDLTQVKGSGPNGRITRRDVETANQSGASTAQESKPAAPQASRPAASQDDARKQATAAQPGSLTPFSKMRDTIARRMQQSVAENPHFYTTVSINMAEALSLREVLKKRDDFQGISVNHLIIKAAATALSREPRVNRAARDGSVYQPEGINIGIITAIEDGLLIPVIKDTDQLTLKDLVFEARAAIERARAGRPNSTDLTGGTFSISNMGMFDVESFTAIINPGQGAVLAVSAVKEEPIVRNGKIVIGKMMKVTLSVDHRVIDGIMSASFLKYFKEALETPALLMI